jgi:hypothetical protein
MLSLLVKFNLLTAQLNLATGIFEFKYEETIETELLFVIEILLGQ